MRHTDRASSARESTIARGHFFFLLLVLFSFFFAAGCHKNRATQASQPQPTSKGEEASEPNAARSDGQGRSQTQLSTAKGNNSGA